MDAVPADGIYAGRLVRGERRAAAGGDLASAPTRRSRASERRVEAFVIDAPPVLDLYGEHVGLTFTARLRDTLRFDGVEPLVAQMDAGRRPRACAARRSPARVSQRPAAPTMTAGTGPRTGPSPKRGLRAQEEPVARILVVDDDASVRALVRDVLELEGHDVRSRRTGTPPCARSRPSGPDGVVLDVVMPGMDGHEVLARLRAMSGGLELPVVMLTASADDATAWRGWPGGVDVLLGKPFDPDELLRSLDGLVARRALTGRRC